MIEIKRSTVTVKLEDPGGAYPFGITKRRGAFRPDYARIEDFELIPYTLELISSCGNFRVIKG